jgi:hypothetical protein
MKYFSNIQNIIIERDISQIGFFKSISYKINQKCFKFWSARWPVPCFINVPQYGVGGDLGTRFCPPLKMPERGLVAGCGTDHPAALYCLLCAAHYSSSSPVTSSFNLGKWFITILQIKSSEILSYP